MSCPPEKDTHGSADVFLRRMKSGGEDSLPNGCCHPPADHGAHVRHTADTNAALCTEVERVLRESGLTDEPEKYDSNIHSWRCAHPDRYGRCDCFTELVTDLVNVISRGKESSDE